MATPPDVPPTGDAAARRALTIGINAYDRVPLKNARNDAEAVHASLRQNGWDAHNELDRLKQQRIKKREVLFLLHTEIIII